jgi:hypothetical protein
MAVTMKSTLSDLLCGLAPGLSMESNILGNQKECNRDTSQ